MTTRFSATVLGLFRYPRVSTRYQGKRSLDDLCTSPLVSLSTFLRLLLSSPINTRSIIRHTLKSRHKHDDRNDAAHLFAPLTWRADKYPLLTIPDASETNEVKNIFFARVLGVPHCVPQVPIDTLSKTTRVVAAAKLRVRTATVPRPRQTSFNITCGPFPRVTQECASRYPFSIKRDTSSFGSSS